MLIVITEYQQMNVFAMMIPLEIPMKFAVPNPRIHVANRLVVLVLNVVKVSIPLNVFAQLVILEIRLFSVTILTNVQAVLLVVKVPFVLIHLVAMIVNVLQIMLAILLFFVHLPKMIVLIQANANVVLRNLVQLVMFVKKAVAEICATILSVAVVLLVMQENVFAQQDT